MPYTVTVIRYVLQQENASASGAPPDPTEGAYSASPDSLAGLRGLLLRKGKGAYFCGDGKGTTLSQQKKSTLANTLPVFFTGTTLY